MRFPQLLTLFLLTFGGLETAQAQLDSIHWLPPMHARSELGSQYLYISTPETTPFPVTIRDGGGVTQATVTISNGQPARFSLGTSGDTKVLVLQNDLHKALQNKGLILSGDKKFYVNFRFHSSSEFHAADLTCKGRSALGQVFRIGHIFQAPSSSRRSNFVGVMASEDSTLVTLSDFDPDTDFEIGGVTTAVNGPQTVLLNTGESVVFSQYVSENFNQPPNGLIGAKLSATKPVAVNCGSWTGSPQDDSNDVGIDQIAPFELVGKEYILCKGNGSAILETPLVIAHVDNTKVFLNGLSSPAALLGAGEFLRIPTSSYSSKGNLYIQTSEPAFVYQIIGGVSSGDDAKRTAGLIFVPPISCSIPNAVNNIYQPNQIGAIKYDGGLMIVAMKDSIVEVRVNDALASLGVADPVTGNPDFVTYRRLALFNDASPPNTASVIAHGAVQVALFGRNGAAGYGAFYSGFSKTDKAAVDLRLKGDGVCPDTLVAEGRFDGIQWYFADSLLTYGPDSFLVAYSPGRYIARGYLGVCRLTDFAEDTVTAQFNSPVFPYSTEGPSCYNFSDGQVIFGLPSGGLEPFEYSVDQGQHFFKDPVFNTLRAGTYQLVARDSTGCYNRPLEVRIDQPDSLSVQLQVGQNSEVVKVGALVLLNAIPNRPVVQAQWLPAQSGTPDFLQFSVRPLQTTDYTVVVTDDEGCTASDTVRIKIEPNIFAPNIFYPESSVGNDRFTLFSKDDLLIHWLRIYDRWGGLVFENREFYTNDVSSGWDGSVRGAQATPGVFVFVAEVEYEPGLRVQVQGDITLMR